MLLYHEIHEQPQVIQRLLDEEQANISQIAAAIRTFDPVFVSIAARGTSDNAGRYAQYALGIQADLPVALATPSVHTFYESPPRLKRALVIGISQSGQAQDVLRVIEDAQAQGALTLSITNDPESPLAQAADHHIYLRCEEERSIAATKTYTAQLTVLALLTAHLSPTPNCLSDLKQLPDWVRQTLALTEPIGGWAERYRYMERIAIIGRGYNYSTAFEIGLKLKELCYVVSQEYSEADFRHGPIAVIGAGFPVIMVAPKGKALEKQVEMLHILAEKSAEVLLISNDESLKPLAKQYLPLPADLPEWLSPIAAVIPGQVFAWRLAFEMGHSIDTPRGLNKVTVTQ